MTAGQGRLAIVAALVVLTALLLRAAAETGEWTGFVVTEIGMLVPLAIAWHVLGGDRTPRS